VAVPLWPDSASRYWSRRTASSGTNGWSAPGRTPTPPTLDDLTPGPARRRGKRAPSPRPPPGGHGPDPLGAGVHRTGWGGGGGGRPSPSSPGAAATDGGQRVAVIEWRSLSSAAARIALTTTADDPGAGQETDSARPLQLHHPRLPVLPVDEVNTRVQQLRRIRYGSQRPLRNGEFAGVAVHGSRSGWDPCRRRTPCPAPARPPS